MGTSAMHYENFNCTGHDQLWCIYTDSKFYIAIGKGREVLELCWLGASYTHVLRSQWGTFCYIAWGCLVGMKTHMGFLLRQYPWPLARWWMEKEVMWCDLRGQRCWPMDFWQKRKVCGMTSVDLRNFGEKGSRVVQPPQCEKHKKKSLKCVYNSYNRFHYK